MTLEQFPQEVVEGHPMYTGGINAPGSGNSPGEGKVEICLLFTSHCKELQWGWKSMKEGRTLEDEGKDRNGGLEYSVLSATAGQMGRH